MKQGHRRNPTFAALKDILACIDDSPRSFTEIWRSSNRDESTVRGALNGLTELGLVEKKDLPRSTWVGHSRPKTGWIRIIQYPRIVTTPDKTSDGPSNINTEEAI